MIEERRSIRKYTNQKVSIEQIETIINSARLAPSFAYDDLMKFINSDGQLIGAVTVVILMNHQTKDPESRYKIFWNIDSQTKNTLLNSKVFSCVICN